MNNNCYIKKCVLVLATLVLAFFACSCAGPPKEDTSLEAAGTGPGDTVNTEMKTAESGNAVNAETETPSPENTTETEEPADGVDPASAIEDNAVWHDSGYVTIPTVIRQTFYGSISEDVSDLPTQTLEKTLQANHIDPATVPGYFQKTILSGPEYTIDLSRVEPICFTTDGELVCKLRNDPTPILLIVLDSAENPTSARYYFSDSWDISQEQAEFLMDDKKPDSQELIVCKKLFQIHLDHEGMDEVFGIYEDPEDVTSHTITVLFDNYPGLEYRFYFHEYAGDAGYFVETLPDGEEVQVTQFTPEY